MNVVKIKGDSFHEGRFFLRGKKIERPSDAWLRRQDDPRMRRSASAQWYHMIAVDGGAVAVPAPLIVRVRTATDADVRKAMRNANQDGKLLIREMPWKGWSQGKWPTRERCYRGSAQELMDRHAAKNSARERAKSP